MGAWLGRLLIRLYARTCRVSVIAGADDFEAARSGSEAVLVGFWHEHLPPLTPFLLYRLHLAGRPIAYLVSRSRDGDLAERMMRGWDLVAVRGSSSKGATTALRDLHRLYRDQRRSPLIVVDGPRGPARQTKPGLAALGRLTGASTLLVAAAARPARRLRSWDRMLVPWLFAHVRVAAELVPPNAWNDDSVEGRTEEIGRRLETLRRKAESRIHP